MRVWFAYIDTVYDKSTGAKEGEVFMWRTPTRYALKGVVDDFTLVRTDGTFHKVARTIGLGYADFKDEKDFVERRLDVVRKKLAELGIEEGAS